MPVRRPPRLPRRQRDDVPGAASARWRRGDAAHHFYAIDATHLEDRFRAAPTLPSRHGFFHTFRTPPPPPGSRLRRAILRVPIWSLGAGGGSVSAASPPPPLRRLGALPGPIVEERMSQSIRGLDARRRRVLEHAPHELDEEAVVF